MNLQNLRDELTTRAAAVDDRPADLLPGISTKIRRTRRRRVAGAVVAATAAVVLAVTVVPGVLTTSAPDPSQRTPSAGYTLPAQSLGGALLKGHVGERGQTHLEFEWIPTTKGIAISAVCLTRTDLRAWVRINDYTLRMGPCSDEGAEAHGIAGESAVWADAPLGQPAKVTVDLIDLSGKTVQDPQQQLALGIYTEPGGPMPKVSSARAGDHTKGGLIIRGTVGKQTLLAAAIGDRGQAEVVATFTSTGGPVAIRLRSTANGYTYGAPYRIQLRFSDGTELSRRPGGGYQADVKPNATITPKVPAGQEVTVTALLTDSTGRPATEPKGTIGLGVYDAR